MVKTDNIKKVFQFKLLQSFIWQWRGIWITTPVVTGIVIMLRFFGLLQSWEWAVYDQFMRLRPTEPADQRIAIVGISEADVRKLGRWPISDGDLAKLLTKIKARKPRVIGLDLYRDLSVPPGHEKLLEIFNNTPNLIGIQKAIGEEEWEVVPPPPALEKKGQAGANDLIYDADNTRRRGLLLVNRDGKTIYSFSLLLAAIYLDKLGIKPELAENTDNWWKFNNTVFPPFDENDGGYVHADAGGYQLLINYRGPTGTIETVSLTDIWEDKLPPDWGKDRIILIGAVGVSFKDIFPTPYSSSLLRVEKPMSGVEIHANIVSQILSATLDDRPLIKTWSEPAEYLWILFWSGVGAILTWNLRLIGGVNSFDWVKVAAFSVASGSLLIITYGAFLKGWWLPVVPPFLGLAGNAIAITSYIARSAGDIRKTFGRYLNDEVVANLLEHPEGLKLGGERRKITIFTSDLRGFTAISERFSPEDVVKILNFYLGKMADVITKYQGTIDEFMGDGILVLFGAPTAREDDAIRAIACAIEMQLAMVEVNEQMLAWDLPTLEMGIGINTGDVVVGNIGSDRRTKYGVVGSNVNLTYRIESYTIGGQILISENTFNLANNLVVVKSEKHVQPKGVAQPITIYDVVGLRGKYNLSLLDKQETLVNLPDKIKLQFHILEGKDVTYQIYYGYLVKLSEKEALIDCNDGIINPNMIEKPPVLSNLKINLLDWHGIKRSDDIYGKVLEKPGENSCFYLRFTNQPPDIAHQLGNLYKSLLN